MSQTINIAVGDQGEVVTLSGIPADMWTRFKERSEKQFPTNEGMGWAQYLSEVIAAVGGENDNASYFMTNVPIDYVNALAAHLAQVEMTWNEFHALLLRTALVGKQLRIANFKDSGSDGVFIALGVDPSWFKRVEEVTGRGFEAVMATILFSAGNGSLAFGPESQFLEPIKNA